MKSSIRYKFESIYYLFIIIFYVCLFLLQRTDCEFHVIIFKGIKDFIYIFAYIYYWFSTFLIPVTHLWLQKLEV